MPAPTVDIRKTDGNTGVIRPGADGILAIIAPATAGDLNIAASFTRKEDMVAAYGGGPLPEYGAWIQARSAKPVVLVRSNATTVATYGTITVATPGTATFTAGSTAPADDYRVVVRFPVAGTVGTAGIRYQYSLDNGENWSAVLALGTATTIAITGAGVSFTIGAGTVLAGTEVRVATTAARLQTTDLTTALEALRLTKSPFEAILPFGAATPAMIAALQSWQNARDAEGRYFTSIVNTDRRIGTQTEAQYKASLDATYGDTSAVGVVVCADGFSTTSEISGRSFIRDTALAVAGRGMGVDISVDAGRVADGPLVAVQIKDSRGNPVYHDEELYPGLDDSRFTTLRTFNQLEGVYITNPLLFSASGSDYVYWQHMRVMNRACSITKQLLTQRLSAGIKKRRDPNNPNRSIIAEEEALEIESVVTTTLQSELGSRTTDCGFILNRDDDLSSNAGAVLHGTTWIVSLAYAKKFAIEAKFLRTVPASLAA